MKVEAVTSTNCVSLGVLRPEHVNSRYIAWLADPDVIRFTEIAGPQTGDSIRAYVLDAGQSSSAAMWRILVKGRGHVGNIRLSNIRIAHRRAEIALLVGDKACWGKGVGSAAIELVTSYAFKVLEMEKLVAGILSPNIGSRRAFEKAGFHCEGILKSHSVIDGERCDNVLMARFKRSQT